MTHNAEIDVSPAIKALNPDLETAWRTIAWWQQTCAYWRDEAQKGYALRDSLDASVTPPAECPPDCEKDHATCTRNRWVLPPV